MATGLTDQDHRRIEDALDLSVSNTTQQSYASKRTLFKPIRAPLTAIAA